MKKFLIGFMFVLTLTFVLGVIGYVNQDTIQHQVRLWTDLEYAEEHYYVVKPPYGLRETTVSLSGEPLTSYDQIANGDQRILIIFWYVDCHWCELSFPAIQKVHEEGDLVVVGLNFRDDAADAQQKIDALGVTFENYIDAKLPRGVIGTPFTVVLERTELGEWVQIDELTWYGFIDSDELIWEKIDSLGE